MSHGYGYIIETSHGDVSYAADTHHEEHHHTVEDWWNRHKDTIFKSLQLGVSVVGVWISIRGTKVKRIL